MIKPKRVKPTEEQKIQWLKEGKCHVCGSKEPHGHPEATWLSNPPPKSSDPTIKERIDAENKLNNTSFKRIIGA